MHPSDDSGFCSTAWTLKSGFPEARLNPIPMDAVLEFGGPHKSGPPNRIELLAVLLS